MQFGQGESTRTTEEVAITLKEELIYRKKCYLLEVDVNKTEFQNQEVSFFSVYGP